MDATIQVPADLLAALLEEVRGLRADVRRSLAKPVMTYDEAAEYLTIHKNTLRLLVKEGEIPVARLGHGSRKSRVVLRKEDLDAYLDARGTRLPPPDPEDQTPLREFIARRCFDN